MFFYKVGLYMITSSVLTEFLRLIYLKGGLPNTTSLLSLALRRAKMRKVVVNTEESGAYFGTESMQS